MIMLFHFLHFVTRSLLTKSVPGLAGNAVIYMLVAVGLSIPNCIAKIGLLTAHIHYTRQKYTKSRAFIKSYKFVRNVYILQE